MALDDDVRRHRDREDAIVIHHVATVSVADCGGGREAGRLGDPRPPHMLKHSCGYYLADKGYDTRLIQDYMGHKQIQNTVRYTQTNARRFEGLWR